jgi:hypothetical protein
LAVGLDAMLKAVKLPASVTGLDTGLTCSCNRQLDGGEQEGPTEDVPEQGTVTARKGTDFKSVNIFSASLKLPRQEELNQMTSAITKIQLVSSAGLTR